MSNVYYFIVYAWKSNPFQELSYSDKIIQTHPLEWLAEIRGITRYENQKYYLIFWEEIPEDIAHKYFLDL